jgi:hypothetical protein
LTTTHSSYAETDFVTTNHFRYAETDFFYLYLF